MKFIRFQQKYFRQWNHFAWIIFAHNFVFFFFLEWGSNEHRKQKKVSVEAATMHVWTVVLFTLITPCTLSGPSTNFDLNIKYDPKKRKKMVVECALQAAQSSSNDNTFAQAHATEQPLVETIYGKCRKKSMHTHTKQRDATIENMKWDKDEREKNVCKQNTKIHIS